MADMSADLRDRLKAASLGATVYRDEREQGAPLPSVVLLVVSAGHPVTHDGEDALRDTLVQIDIDAASRGAANAIAEKVISAVLPAGGFGKTAFSRSFVEGDRQSSSRPTGLATIFRTSLDLRVWHQPAA